MLFWLMNTVLHIKSSKVINSYRREATSSSACLVLRGMSNYCSYEWYKKKSAYNLSIMKLDTWDCMWNIIRNRFWLPIFWLNIKLDLYRRNISGSPADWPWCPCLIGRPWRKIYSDTFTRFREIYLINEYGRQNYHFYHRNSRNHFFLEFLWLLVYFPASATIYAIYLIVA